MLKDKRLDLGIIISIVFHILLFLLLSHTTQASVAGYEDINEITFIDQSYRPEVSKVISKGSVWSGMKETYTEEAPSSYGGGEVTTPAIDLSAKLDRSQAKINLDRYAGSEGIGDVVKIGSRAEGTMKSTEEILAEKPISLAKNLRRGVGQGKGIGGGGGIGIKKQVPSITITKRPPPPKTSAIGRQVEHKVEQKLRVSKGRTQISLAGPIANRAILKKFLPKYPQWCLSRGISGVVKIRIWVEPDGRVREGTLVEVSSGYPDLDQAVINALRLWKFAPLPAGVVQETQWGIITFRFVLG